MTQPFIEPLSKKQQVYLILMGLKTIIKCFLRSYLLFKDGYSRQSMPYLSLTNAFRKRQICIQRDLND